MAATARFGLNLKAALAKVGLTQQEAAERLGLTQATVSYYCRLEAPPRRHIVEFIASRLGIDIEDLLGPAVVRDGSGKTYGAAGKGQLSVGHDLLSTWLKGLRRRYRRSPEDREEIRVIVRRCFARRDQEEILAWLSGEPVDKPAPRRKTRKSK